MVVDWPHRSTAPRGPGRPNYRLNLRLARQSADREILIELLSRYQSSAVKAEPAALQGCFIPSGNDCGCRRAPQKSAKRSHDALHRGTCSRDLARRLGGRRTRLNCITGPVPMGAGRRPSESSRDPGFQRRISRSTSPSTRWGVTPRICMMVGATSVLRMRRIVASLRICGPAAMKVALITGSSGSWPWAP